MDGFEPDPVGPDQFPERFQGNRIPSFEDLCFEVLVPPGPTIFAVPDPSHHPRPNNLDEVEVGTVRRPRRQTVQFPRLFRHLRTAVLFPPITHTLLTDEPPDLVLLRLCRPVPNDVDVVVCVGRADGVVVVWGRVVLHQLGDAQVPHRGVKRLCVDLQCLRGVLHAGWWLEVGPLRQDRTARAMPVANLPECRLVSSVLWWVFVGVPEVFHVTHVAVIAGRPRLHNPVHARVTGVVLLLEDGAVANVFRVPVGDLEVGRTPRDSGCLAVPADAAPEVYTLLHAAFFRLIVRHLQKSKDKHNIYGVAAQ